MRQRLTKNLFCLSLAVALSSACYEVDNPVLDLKAGSVLVQPKKSTASGGEQPVTNARVALVTSNQVLAQARADGSYLLENVPVGPFALFLAEPDTGLQARVEGFEVLDGSDAVSVGRVLLQPAQSELLGTVSVSGGSSEGAVVCLPFSGVSTRVRADGGFSLRRVPRGATQIAVVLPGIGATAVDLPLAAGTIALTPVTSAQPMGRVVKRGTGPLQGASVTLRFGAEYESVTSNSDGIFRFTGVPTGVYQMTVSASGATTVVVPNVPVAAGVDIPTVVLGPTTPADFDGDKTVDDADTDQDNDGVINDDDDFPFNRHEWADTDGDGVGDNWDNCPGLDNADQKDTDRDGVGDACEP